MKNSALIIGLGMIFFACSPKTTEVTETAEILNFPNETVSTGYALYGSECTKCHKAKEVKKYSREEWNKILPSMAKKAKLVADQEATIDAYVNWELAR